MSMETAPSNRARFTAGDPLPHYAELTTDMENFTPTAHLEEKISCLRQFLMEKASQNKTFTETALFSQQKQLNDHEKQINIVQSNYRILNDIYSSQVSKINELIGVFNTSSNQQREQLFQLQSTILHLQTSVVRLEATVEEQRLQIDSLKEQVQAEALQRTTNSFTSNFLT